jgi:hypothetical protein
VVRSALGLCPRPAARSHGLAPCSRPGGDAHRAAQHFVLEILLRDLFLNADPCFAVIESWGHSGPAIGICQSPA